MKEKFSGVIEIITYHNPENGFAVLKVQPTGKRGVSTVVGTIINPLVGEYLEATGEWVQNRDHGLQFKAEEMHTTPPYTAEGILKYLGSGLVKGIGPQYARRIVEAFGARTLQVIDESPGYLSEIKGIGAKRIQKIRESWQEQKAVREIMVFLQSHGMGTARAVRIYKTYGDQAIRLVRENPYRLATDIWGVGFDSADQLAQKLGIDPQSPLRAAAAVRFTLQNLGAEAGHCGFPELSLVELTVRETEKRGAIPREVLAASIEDLRAADEVVREPFAGAAGQEPWIYLKPLFLAESNVAAALRKLKEGGPPLPDVDVDAALVWVEQRMGLMLAESQREAIRMAARNKVLVVTGGPGVGKTTIVRGILEIFSARQLRCALCAPTGRAAKRLSETTGREAKTIHRLLEFDPAFGGFKKNRNEHLDLDLLIVDETSMLDVVLMNQLLRALPPWACLVLVGDVDQLPSVGPGAVLGDVIRSETVPVVRLTEIFRQAGESSIIRAAHRVNRGEMPEPEPADRLSDFYVIECDSPDGILARTVTMIRQRIPARFGLDPIRDVQVLTPMNRSDLGARNLNLKLQEVLNPPDRGKPEEQRSGWTFRLGDKVIQTQNNYKKEVFNGDIGRVAAVDRVEREVTVDFDGRPVVYDFGELDELSLAYALTVHKSQGSEYPAVIIPVHAQHSRMLQRNLLYTGITRGKKLVVLVGQRRAIRQAAQREDTSRRFTGLCWRLRQE